MADRRKIKGWTKTANQTDTQIAVAVD